MSADTSVDALLAKIQSSRKYQELGLPEETLRNLLEQELARHAKPAEALKSARAKLHNIMAPYLGDPDYTQAAEDLQQAFAQGEAAVQATCTEILRQHDSTRANACLTWKTSTRAFAACAGNPGRYWTWPAG